MYKYVVGSNREEILKRRQLYDDMKDRREDEEYEWKLASKQTLDEIAKSIRHMIGPVDIGLDIDVDTNMHDNLSITISNARNPHVKNQALTWSWTTELSSEGEIIKKSGSWSGLDATTPKELANLRETVKVLEIINNLDWDSILHTKLPKYEDYVKTDVPEPEDFDRELLISDINDIVGTDRGIKGYGYYKYKPNDYVIYRITDQSDTQYRVREILENHLDDRSKWSAPYNVSKQKFLDNLIRYPVKFVDL